VAWDWVFLAMAHARLGRHDEAHQWPAKTAPLVDQLDGAHASKNPEVRALGWHQRLELQLLRREAEKVLKDASKDNRP